MKLTVDPKAKALIFDLDGTMADTMPTHYLSWKKVAEQHGFEFPEAWFYEWAGVRTQKIAELLNERLGIDLDPAAAEEEKETAFLDMIRGNIRPIKEVTTLVEKYHGKMPMACGTGNLRDIAQLTLEAIGMAPYFNILVSANEVENYKPAPDTFLKCAQMMGVAPEVCQVFEDGEAGLQAARTAGMIANDIRPFV